MGGAASSNRDDTSRCCTGWQTGLFARLDAMPGDPSVRSPSTSHASPRSRGRLSHNKGKERVLFSIHALTTLVFHSQPAATQGRSQ